MAATVKRHKWSIIKIGSLCIALLAIMTFSDKIMENTEKGYLIPLIKSCHAEEFRELRIMIEFNRQQALADTNKMVLWNKAIDIVDNAGRVK